MPVVSDEREDKPKRKPSVPFIVSAVVLVLLGLVVIPLFNGFSARLGNYEVAAKIGEARRGYGAHRHGLGSESWIPGGTSYWLRVGGTEAVLELTDQAAVNRYLAAMAPVVAKMRAAWAARMAKTATRKPARTLQLPRQPRLPHGER